MARRSFGHYCNFINPNFEKPDHIKKIVEKLEKVESGEIDRLIISMPPRHGKSFTVSDYFPSWFLGRNPGLNIIQTSYGDELSVEFGRKVKDRIEGDEKFRLAFPKCKISQNSRSSSKFNTEEGGAYYAIGRGGAITGRGGDLIIVDDLIKNSQEASSQAIIKEIKNWYSTTLYTRLTPKGRIIIVATRWSEKDLTGYVKELEKNDPYNKKWDELVLPAIDENNNALWPEKFPIESLLSTKHQIGSYYFNALYQQKPSPAEGGIIQRSWIKSYKELPSQIDDWCMSWDMTFKESSTSDFVVGQVWARSKGEFFLVDQVRDRMNFPSTVQAFKNLVLKYPKIVTKLVEAKANGQAVIDSLKKEISGIIPINPTEGKISRLSAVSPMFEAGNIYFPETSWTSDLIEELVSFPNGSNDDQCDGLSQALSYMRSNSSTIPQMSLVSVTGPSKWMGR